MSEQSGGSLISEVLEKHATMPFSASTVAMDTVFMFCPPVHLYFLPFLTLAGVLERQRCVEQTKCDVSGRMRLILIREPVITFLLLSLMLTTSSPPICLSFTMTISLCLTGQRLPHCQPACVSFRPSYANLLHA